MLDASGLCSHSLDWLRLDPEHGTSRAQAA